MLPPPTSSSAIPRSCISTMYDCKAFHALKFPCPQGRTLRARSIGLYLEIHPRRPPRALTPSVRACRVAARPCALALGLALSGFSFLSHPGGVSEGDEDEGRRHRTVEVQRLLGCLAWRLAYPCSSLRHRERTRSSRHWPIACGWKTRPRGTGPMTFCPHNL